MQPAQVILTDKHSGERLEDVQLREGDLVIGDRAYGIWRAVREALDALAHFILRLTWLNLPLLTPDGEPFDLIAWLRGLPETKEQKLSSLQPTIPKNALYAWWLGACLQIKPRQREKRYVAKPVRMGGSRTPTPSRRPISASG